MTSQSGSALVMTLVGIIAVISLTIAGLGSARSSLRVARNYETGLQALLAAEAGSVHAHEMISDNGVLDFATDIVDQWEAIYGSGWREMPGYPQYRWQSTVTDDTVDPTDYVILTTIGEAPNASRRVIVARLKVGNVYSPGAIYLPSPGVAADFHGNKFLVDGHDTNLDGSLNTDVVVPGITTRDPTAKDDVEAELSTGQENNVIGVGNNPSVEQSWGPTSARIQNEIVPEILAQGGVVTNPVLNGNDTFGKVDSPQITHFTGDITVKANGTMDGAGILIVDGGLKINGNLSFVGLIIVRGTTEITTVTGNATILGSLWTTNLDLVVAGSASVTYSTEALELASGLGAVELIPQRADAVGWRES